jgi:glycosyltransferase involved in cell wall biosynthesis/GT2 family glycosyltransferase
VPLVSVVLAVHNDARYVGAAVASMLRQSVRDLELVVVDDASTDATPALLRAVSDSRLRVLTNDEQLGLARSLNRALDSAQGKYFARLDSDDVAFPERLALQLERMDRQPRIGILGTAVLDLDETDRPGTLHRNPRSPLGVRWLSLFGSPFFHPTVLVRREALEADALRYDGRFLESEDYDLWARLLAGVEGANLAEALVLKRFHPGQASIRRSELQISFQREVALREIARVAPELSPAEAELAWGFGSGRDAGGDRDAYLTLLRAFEREHGLAAEVRDAAARVLGRPRPSLAIRRVRRLADQRRARRKARAWLSSLAAPARPLRVVVVSPEPTPYRSPLFDRVAARPELELTVVYAAETVAGRTWTVQARHPTVVLGGIRLPGLRRALRHDYPVTPAIGRALHRANPDVVVVSGWSTFASQTAVAWCRARRIPYVLLVESHDLGPRRGWRRAVKSAVVPRLVRGAAGVLAVGTAARESMIARGAEPDRVRIFANTIDVAAWSERAERLAARRADGDDVVVLCAGRLVPEKGLDLLVRAIAQAGDPRLRLEVAGEGPQRTALTNLAQELGVRLTILGEVPEERLAEEYAAADVFALLSLHETWGVVVNEAAASGLPLVLSDRVGAAYDLLRHGENGFLIPAGDLTAAAAALRALATDRALRERAGARSRELVRDWGYEPSVDNFVAAVREATSR